MSTLPDFPLEPLRGSDNIDWRSYEMRRAEFYKTRLRLAVEALETIQCGDDKSAHVVATKAIAAIGDLPE